MGIGAFISFRDDGPFVDIELNLDQKEQVLGRVETDETSQLGETVVGAEPIFKYFVAASPGPMVVRWTCRFGSMIRTRVSKRPLAGTTLRWFPTPRTTICLWAVH